MYGWHLRPFRLPGVRRVPFGPRKGQSLLLSAVLGIGLALLCIGWIDMRFRPILGTMATAKVTNAVTQTLDGAISDQITNMDISYSDLINMEKDETGRVTALTSNMAVLNGLRTGILGTVVSKVDEIDAQNLSIPTGNLLGINFFSGRGLALPISVVSVGSAHATFENFFSDAGINQTRHQIMLDVTVTVDILLPSETLRTNVTAQVCVAETVIVGTVPDTYLQVSTQKTGGSTWTQNRKVNNFGASSTPTAISTMCWTPPPFPIMNMTTPFAALRNLRPNTPR